MDVASSLKASVAPIQAANQLVATLTLNGDRFTSSSDINVRFTYRNISNVPVLINLIGPQFTLVLHLASAEMHKSWSCSMQTRSREKSVEATSAGIMYSPLASGDTFEEPSDGNIYRFDNWKCPLTKPGNYFMSFTKSFLADHSGVRPDLEAPPFSAIRSYGVETNTVKFVIFQK